MVRGALEVVEFVPRQPTDAARIDYPDRSGPIGSRLRLEHRALTSCAAALASIALHALLLGPALWASGSPPHPADRKYAGATALQWVVLDDAPAVVATKPASPTSPVLVAVRVSDILPTPELLASAPDASEDKNAQTAADLGAQLERASRTSGVIAAAGALGTLLAGAGEGVSFGFDTPVTISFGSITTYFTTVSFVSGAGAAALKSFASGNLASLGEFDFSELEDMTIDAAARRFPGGRELAETIASVGEAAADLLARAKEACQ